MISPLRFCDLVIPPIISTEEDRDTAFHKDHIAQHYLREPMDPDESRTASGPLESPPLITAFLLGVLPDDEAWRLPGVSCQTIPSIVAVSADRNTALDLNR